MRNHFGKNYITQELHTSVASNNTGYCPFLYKTIDHDFEEDQAFLQDNQFDN